jgi:hypothetical protein
MICEDLFIYSFLRAFAMLLSSVPDQWKSLSMEESPK